MRTRIVLLTVGLLTLPPWLPAQGPGPKAAKQPVLLIDGGGQRREGEFGDAFYVNAALTAVPKSPYEVTDAGKAVDALEKRDLATFKGIYLLNVPELSAGQVTKLEKYLQDGGGVAFFVGPRVSAKHVNEQLYRDGKGFFEWSAVDAAAYRKEVLGRQLALLRHLGLAPEAGAALKARTR